MHTKKDSNSNNQNLHRPFRRIVEAQRKASERFEKLTSPSRYIAEILKQQKEVMEKIRKLTEQPPHLKIIFEQIRQQQQQMYDHITDIFKKIAIPDYTNNIKSMANQLKMSNSVNKALRQYRLAFDKSNILTSMIKARQISQKRMLEASMPSFNIQKSLETEMTRINVWKNTCKSLTDNLKDFRPTVKVLKDAIVIQNERFSHEEITQIAEEYIWDENSNKNAFQLANKKKFWESIPKPILFIILVVLTLYIQIFWKGFTKNTIFDLDRIEKQGIHIRKTLVRQIRKGQGREINPPFVNTEYLPVYINPRMKSKIISVLSYPCEVKILAYKKKKRFLLIEWADSNGEIHQGWTLGRYIYRKNEIE